MTSSTASMYSGVSGEWDAGQTYRNNFPEDQYSQMQVLCAFFCCHCTTSAGRTDDKLYFLSCCLQTLMKRLCDLRPRAESRISDILLLVWMGGRDFFLLLFFI